MSEMVIESYENAEFRDERLTKRYVTIIDRLSAKPHLSIPAAMENRAEMEAAYRFFNNPKVSPEAIMAPHISATLERIRGTDVVLLVQDTTEIDVTRPEQQVQGTGPLESEVRLGAFYHPLFAFDVHGLPLGTAWSKSWVRDELATDITAAEKRKKRDQIPFEEKESLRWVEGFRAGLEVAKSCPQTQCVCVADSAADLYELFSEPRNANEIGELHWLVRACQNRALTDQQGLLLEAVLATPCLYECAVDVKKRKSMKANESRQRLVSRDARIASVEVRATTVTLRPPYRKHKKLPEITVSVVLVDEPNPPAGQPKIQWMLITTLPVDHIEQVQRVVHYYATRWQIEVYFRTLKSGCRVEERYFERLGRLLNCFAVYTVVAWKVFYLSRLSRECPELNCEVIFEPCEWKPVYMAVRRKQPPKIPPTLNEIIRMIASLGGFVIRPKNQPGTQTLWIGLQRLHDLSTAWKTFGPESRTC